MTIWHEGAVRGGPLDRPLRDASSLPNLPHAEQTLAELFQAQGYLTAHVGKWHLGTAAYYPETQGYDLNLGGTFWALPATFFAPFRGPWSETDPEFRYVPLPGPTRRGEYLPDRLTDEAIRVMQQAGDQPFFLSLWYYTVHSPIEAPAELVARFRAKAVVGPQQDPTYAAMVHRLDVNLGRLLQTLEQLGLREQTVVILTSDNGGVDFPVRSITPTSNSPLRSGKGTLYEGGLRVPCLIRWPGRTTAGAVCGKPICSQDFFPTLVEAFQFVPEPGPRDGASLLGLLENPDGDLPRDTLFWHFPHYYPRMTPGSAIRRGRLETDSLLRAGSGRVVRPGPRPQRIQQSGGCRARAGADVARRA